MFRLRPLRLFFLTQGMTYQKRKQKKVFNGIPEKGKSTMSWFFDFKLHLIIIRKGELLSFYLTKGNVEDRDIELITAMTKEIFGKLFGYKGYISKTLFELLF